MCFASVPVISDVFFFRLRKKMLGGWGSLGTSVRVQVPANSASPHYNVLKSRVIYDEEGKSNRRGLMCEHTQIQPLEKRGFLNK